MLFEKSKNRFRDRIKSFLVAKYPNKTAANVASDTGCNPQAIQKWLDSDVAQNSEAFARLIIAYGPEFLAAVFPSHPQWVVDALSQEKEAELRAEFNAAKARLDAFMTGR